VAAISLLCCACVPASLLVARTARTLMLRSCFVHAWFPIYLGSSLCCVRWQHAVAPLLRGSSGRAHAVRTCARIQVMYIIMHHLESR
jgi:hypothetical protein